MVKRETMRTWLVKRGLAVALIALTCQAYAGLPEPWMMLYGQVRDDSSVLLNTGTLLFQFTPVEGGETYEYSVELGAIEAPGGPYSYALRIPLESEVEGYVVNPGVLELPLTSAGYTRTASVDGAGISMTHSVTLTQADRGMVKRVDVCTNCSAMGAGCHTADWDQSYSFSLSELLRVVELFTFTSDHVYHVNADSEDGYAPGLGSVSGMPHSTDYTEFGDWQFSLSELLRMLDLFSSTPNHTYHPDSSSEDGFVTGPLPKGAGDLFPESLDSPAMEARRFIRGGAVGADPASLEISLDIQAHEAINVTALGLEDYLPEGWTYAGLSSKGAPEIAPIKGVGALAEFAWMNPPSFPVQFSYAVEYPSESTLANAILAYDGVGLYRVLGGKHGYSATVALGRRIAQNDLNGDGVIDDWDGDGQFDDWNNNGVADYREGIEDTDGDGVPDDFDGDGVADDANDDGVADAAAWAGDTDGDGLTDDFDRDGLADDRNNNGVADVLEGIEDTDGDGVPDDYDGDGEADDVNNNGVADAVEATTDIDGDGVADWVEGGEDSDGDGVPNFVDVDSDNDGLLDTQDPVSASPLFAFLDVRAHGDTVLVPEDFTYRLAVQVAGGLPPYRYHWKHQSSHKGVQDIGADQAVVLTEAFGIEQEGLYYCVVEDALGVLAASDSLHMLLKDDPPAQMPVGAPAGLALLALACIAGGARQLRKRRSA